ncbi:MAG: redoxin domain-containing protein [Planctomycetaceae bacterium]
MRAAWLRCVPGVVCGLLLSAPVQAQKREVTVEYILSTFKPQHSDVEIDTPDKKEWAKCKVELIGQNEGYLVLGPAGQTLRRFLDTNGDDKTDQWGYYNGGLEVYRELDTNGNNKIDQVRWLNLGGTRWGLDTNEDGRIDEWKMISAEEVSRMAVRALVANDPDLLAPLLINAEDIQSLGLKGPLEEALLKSVEGAPAKLAKVARGSKVITPRTAWRRFDSSGPGVIPADTHRSRGDLFVTENAMAFVDYGDAKKQGIVVLGELIRVNDTWKLTGIPTPADPEGNVELPSGIVMFESAKGPVAATGTPTPSGAVSEKMVKLFERLRALQDTPPAGTAPRADWEKHYKELDTTLVLIFNESETDADREQWVRQLLDTINAGVQSGHYPPGIGRMKALEKEIKKKFPRLAAFAEYRRTWAEHTVAMRDAEDDEGRSKVHDKWLKDLEAFLEQYPESEDAAEAGLQLGFEYEFAGKVEKARAWYQKVSTSFAKTESARRSDGALLRLGLNGKPLQIAGTSLAGGPIDSKQFKGRTLLVLFWDTRSKPAAEDLPALKELYEQNHARGFEILGVNLDPEKELANSFIRQRGIAWPQIHEEGGLESPPARKFGIITLPTMFLVDPEGRVISRNASVDDIKAHLSGDKAARK